MIRNTLTSLMASTYMTGGIAFAADGEGAGGAAAKTGQHKTESIDTGPGQSGFSGTLTMDVDGDELKVSDEESTTDHIEVGNGSEDANEDGLDAGAADDKAGEGDDKPKDDEAGDDDDAPTLVEVPDEFKADDPEVVAQFDKALKREDGKLNMDALSAQWWANAQANADGQGSLTQATYDYLDSLLIPPEMVKAAEAGQQALNTQSVQNIYSAAGGKANFDAAISWASKGDKPAYTEAQRQAFNRALDKGGETAKDAIDLLMSRHGKATSGTRTSPGKSAGEHGSSAGSGEAKGGEVFKSRDEWVKARQEAGRDQAKQQAVSNKFRRSPGAAGW